MTATVVQHTSPVYIFLYHQGHLVSEQSQPKTNDWTISSLQLYLEEGLSSPLQKKLAELIIRFYILGTRPVSDHKVKAGEEESPPGVPSVQSFGGFELSEVYVFCF